MQLKEQEKHSMSVEGASSHLLDALKNLFAELFAPGETSQDKALNLLQDSKGFDPVKNPQSLVFPRAVTRERTADKRLPVRKAA
ncbi:MAG TPA: hypothetical protein EYN91_24920 [Candidatus Melainabacteria bacterium]|jgi:hypothetical protein|nr:hypothetical protein [Candidatus Melainabacteria bacterium]HIN63149.1 hypothetical protein [Candidatus Obscuribacterales bacterium]